MTDINKIVPQEAKQDLVDVNNLLGLTVEQVVKLVSESRKIDWGLGGVGNVKNIKDFGTALGNAAANQQKLLNQAGNYNVLTQSIKELDKAENLSITTQAKSSIVRSEANKEVIEYRENIRKANLEIKNEVIVNNAALGSLTHLRAQLNLTKMKYAELGATVRDSDIGKEMLLNVQKFDAAVQKIENDIGVFQRNVGNYNGVQHNMSQVVRELPALGIDFRTFVLAISNNIPMLQDSMNQMKASGKTTQQVWQAMAASLFSMNTLIVVSITAMMMLSSSAAGAELTIGKLNKVVEKDIDLREKSIDLYIDETSHLRVLLEEVENQATSTERIKEIRDELVAEYPKTATNLKDEANLRFKLTDTIGKLNEALIIHAKIKAAEDIIAEKTKEHLMGETSLWQKVKAAAIGAVAGEFNAYRQRLANLKENNDEYEKEMDRLLGFIDKQKGDLNKSGLSGLLGDDKKTESTSAAIPYNEIKVATENIKDLSRVQFDLQTADLRRQMEHNKEIAEDEEATYETRIDALEQYYDLKRRLIIETAEYEKMVGNKSALEIELIDQQTQEHLIDLTNESLAIQTKADQDILKSERELAAEREKLQKENAERVEKNAELSVKIEEEAARKRIALIQKIVEFGKQAADTAVQINRAKTERELDGLDREDRANDIATEREVARIERSTLSETEKEEKIAEVEGRSEARRIEIEQRRIDADKKRAQFEKNMTLAKIALSTYLAVAKAVAENPTLGLFQSGAILALLGGMGAAASTIAIPAYAEGEENHPGGLAWVGDGKEHELVNLPGGKSFLSPDTDTLMNLPAGTSVKPISKLIDESNSMLTPHLINAAIIASGGNTQKMERILSKKLDEVTDAINSKPVPSISFSNGFMYEITTKGHNKRTSIRKNLID